MTGCLRGPDQLREHLAIAHPDFPGQQRCGNDIEPCDRIQVMTRKTDRDGDPWRAQRMRSRIVGAVVVIIVLGAIIALVVLMNAGMTSSGASNAAIATALVRRSKLGC